MNARARGLDAHVVVHRADVTVDVELSVAAGGRLAVLGHNGAGKSTLLHAIAGLLPLEGGAVRLNDVVLEHAGAHRVLPHHRRIGLLDQKARLFPHLSVVRNIAFGPRSQGRTRGESMSLAQEWLERIGLAHRASARPHELSGGQQQRVAIARAFAAEPEVLLLDEPLASLDAESAPGVRRMLVDELARTGTTSILVTHDLADAWQLADDCIVLSDGAVVDSGAPDQLATAPQHPFTAALAGFAVVRGVWHEGTAHVNDQQAFTGSQVSVSSGEAVATGRAGRPGDSVPVGLLSVGHQNLVGTPDARLADGDAAIAVIAPANVMVSAVTGEWRATLTEVSSRGGRVRLDDASGLAAELSIEDARSLTGGRLPASGDTVWFTPAPEHLRVLPVRETSPMVPVRVITD
ncbi:ABC transporter ATP-binding protein [Microbacterium sp. MPKO10]|uniref:ABC transporter ATP-binding protein n=1 Tax=Microbacterium sp. MPKO10 TaxID=2989818 RepID=UPI002235DDE4|nr:ATP-binding cassette domain-containing protein [Microbacterium sp. MPKO10]MCW4458689.1 ATP-binding cassette domain-containing protein [Microbacterium sp. MPKO10]